MQKVQRWSQPFCTCTKARARPSMASTMCAGGLAHGQDVVDARLLEIVDAEIRQGAVVVRLQLLLVAEHEVDLGHGGEGCRLGLRGAAGDDDARVGFSRRALRIACRAWRTASPVTAQVLKMTAPPSSAPSPAASASRRITSDS